MDYCLQGVASACTPGPHYGHFPVEDLGQDLSGPLQQGAEV
jgi:hypothetical protein